MDTGIIHTIAREKLNTLRSEYRQLSAEGQALGDMVENIPHIFPPDRLSLLSEELLVRGQALKDKERELFAQIQIVNYLAGTLLNSVDRSNAQ